MKSVLIFAAVAGVAYAGVGRLNPNEEAEKLQDFQRLCDTGRVPETGELLDLGGVMTWVYCKQEKRGPRVIESTGNATFSVPEPYPQTVFLRPSDWLLHHHVLGHVNATAPKTNIYLVPPKLDSNVTFDVRPITNPPRKPTVYYLNNQSTPPNTPPANAYPPNREQQRLYRAASTVSSQYGTAQGIGASLLPANIGAQQRFLPEENMLVTLDFLKEEFRKNGNNRKVRYYVIRSET